MSKLHEKIEEAQKNIKEKMQIEGRKSRLDQILKRIQELSDKMSGIEGGSTSTVTIEDSVFVTHTVPYIDSQYPLIEVEITLGTLHKRSRHGDSRGYVSVEFYKTNHTPDDEPLTQGMSFLVGPNQIAQPVMKSNRQVEYIPMNTSRTEIDNLSETIEDCLIRVDSVLAVTPA